MSECDECGNHVVWCLVTKDGPNGTCIHKVWCPVANDDEQEGKCQIFVKFNDINRAKTLSKCRYSIVYFFNNVLPEGWHVNKQCDDKPEYETEADEDTPPNITFDLVTESHMINSKLSEADIILIN